MQLVSTACDNFNRSQIASKISVDVGPRPPKNRFNHCACVCADGTMLPGPDNCYRLSLLPAYRMRPSVSECRCAPETLFETFALECLIWFRFLCRVVCRTQPDGLNETTLYTYLLMRIAVSRVFGRISLFKCITVSLSHGRRLSTTHML